jgi:hypothetical protein
MSPSSYLHNSHNISIHKQTQAHGHKMHTQVSRQEGG